MENNEVTTNPESEVITEEEVVETETEEEETDESADWDDDATDEEKEELRKKVEELESKNKSLYDKLKSGYKKHQKSKTESLSKDDVKKMMEDIYREETQEKKLVESYEDAKELLPEIKKLQQEKWFDIDTAYDVVKWKMLRDEGYRNQALGERSKNFGTMEKKEAWFKYKHLFTTPKIARPRNED